MKNKLIIAIAFTSLFSYAENFVVIVDSKDIDTSIRITDQRIGEWSNWIIDKENCSIWSPLVNQEDWNVEFTQKQNCEQDQSRKRNIYNVWTDGSETLRTTEIDTKIINVEKEQPAIGTRKLREMCVNILNRGLSIGDGIYNVDPDGDATVYSPTAAYCDMTNGGWTLYDSFGTKLLQTGQSNPIAYNGNNLNSKTEVQNAGYAFFSGAVNTHGGYGYHFDDYHIQWYDSGASIGYMQKTMPNWIQGVKVNSSNEWYGGTQNIIYGSDNRGVPANKKDSSYIFNDTGGKVLRMQEQGIFWTESIWVK